MMNGNVMMEKNAFTKAFNVMVLTNSEMLVGGQIALMDQMKAYKDAALGNTGIILQKLVAVKRTNGNAKISSNA